MVFSKARGTEGAGSSFTLQKITKGVATVAKMKKSTRIAREKKRLAEIFQGLEPNKLSTCQALIERAAFITVSLEDLEEELNEVGWTEPYQNGANQAGLKKSAAADVHISLTKNLNAIIKQLLDLVPAAQKESRLSAFMSK